MKTPEVLKLVPGLSKDRLYYLEHRGYVKSVRTGSGDYQVRDFPPEEVEKLRVMFKYVKGGYRYSAAHNKALQDLEARKAS